jgi:hypothetical protein
LKTFGGLTEFSRAPARGEWKPEPGEGVERDHIVVFEVMTEALDRRWWAALRGVLEKRLGQDLIVIRAIEVEQL